MKQPQDGQNWFFVDESGDPVFYDRRRKLIVGEASCSPILMLGFIETTDPHSLRQSILKLQQEIVADPYFAGVPSLAKTQIAFHAKDDLPEIRYRVYKHLATLDFRAQFVVARKSERIFLNQFGGNEGVFYDSLITRLFQNVLHRYQRNSIIFAKRGSRDRQEPMQQAIQQAKERFEAAWDTAVTTNITIQAQRPRGEPCLSIIDYMNWAVYRAFTRGEMRFYDTVASKVSLLVDLYDYQQYPKNWYSKKNPFHINKITPL
ncbi:MAG: DUF3800 domain-containing protein [Anaerolineae bacterium]|nr:DUF3800 domain-containing protein [Anaerolineae bacterium]